jgi:hypothetical protein
MGIRKRIAAVISGLAFAGMTAFTLGAAAPAGAHAVTTHHRVAAQGCWDDCGGWHHHWHHYHWNDWDNDWDGHWDEW